MTAWINDHGQLLSRVALVAVIIAVFAPLVAFLCGIPNLVGGVPHPAVNPMQVALVVSGIFAIIGFAVGLAVWILRTPGYELGMAAVLVLGAFIVMFGGIALTGLLMSVAHSPRL
ncbi:MULTISPECIES: hypothetical protein [unclassified Microbacterium]|uniref:hypothetical protein n=1 Tax=unclassified Microbacterium TaxID=2609290 RepID=UPI00214CB976|nr:MULTISPECIES: hypothetical protein [unclassified Microbacterium]MCR2784528.1 hypothetical protein [Microbacterium sp. zg.B96]WIM14661.1 hypothetical protein QNO11_08765 [Microbacterium sp. zg-B96]